MVVLSIRAHLRHKRTDFLTGVESPPSAVALILEAVLSKYWVWNPRRELRPLGLGPPVVPFSSFFLGEGSPTKIDIRYPYSNLKLLEDLLAVPCRLVGFFQQLIAMRLFPAPLRSGPEGFRMGAAATD